MPLNYDENPAFTRLFAVFDRRGIRTAFIFRISTIMVCVNAMGDLIKPNYVTTHFAYLLRKYGMRKIRFHDLRHTCASLLLASDNNMKVIQMWMGHSSMKTTADIYAHLDMSAKNTAAVALAHLFRLDEDDEAEE